MTEESNDYPSSSQPQRQIPEQNDRLERELGLLEESITTLTEKLNQVLLSSESKVDDKKFEVPSLVPLADTLRSSVKRVEDAQSRIHDLINRIEL